MPIQPVPFITLHVDKENGAGHDSTEGEEHYRFEVNEKAVKMLMDVEQPVSVCYSQLLYNYAAIICIHF